MFQVFAKSVANEYGKRVGVLGVAEKIEIFDEALTQTRH